MAPQTERYLMPQAWQKQKSGQGELPRLPAAALPRSVQLPQLNLNPGLRPLAQHCSPSWASIEIKVQMNSS